MEEQDEELSQEEQTSETVDEPTVEAEDEDKDKNNQLKISELENHLQRLQADFENFRRRTRKEKEEFAKYATEQLITAMLPILDNFQRAISSQTNKEEPFVAGVTMIQKQLMDTLQKEGLMQIEAVDNQFDPNYHEAVMIVEDETKPRNTVVEEFQVGYMLKEKVIRPSMVKVANTN